MCPAVLWGPSPPPARERLKPPGQARYGMESLPCPYPSTGMMEPKGGHLPRPCAPVRLGWWQNLGSQLCWGGWLLPPELSSPSAACTNAVFWFLTKGSGQTPRCQEKQECMVPPAAQPLPAEVPFTREPPAPSAGISPHTVEPMGGLGVLWQVVPASITLCALT